MSKLRVWREGKGWTQGDVAGKLGEPRPTYQKMESGAGPLPPDVQGKLRKLGYTGPWPREEAQEAPAARAGAYVTREEFAEARGAWKAEIGMVREALEKMGEAVRLLLLEREQSRQQERK